MRVYDPTWRALLVPGAATDFFSNGRPVDETALCAELSRIAYIGFERNDAEQKRAADLLRRAGFGSAQFLSAGGTECIENYTSTRSIPPRFAFSTNSGIHFSPSTCRAISTTM